MDNVPTPPSRLALLWIGLTAGAAAAAWCLVIFLHLLPGSAPQYRQLIYILIALALTLTASWLTVRYRDRRVRRDSWWDGFSTAEEPIADVVPLRTTNVREPTSVS